MSSIVQRFYTDSLDELPRGERRRARELCDTGLLTSDGHRLPMQKDEVLRNYGISEETLEYLVQRRILREEPRLDSVFYEIGHDTIAKSIYRSRPWRVPKKWRPVVMVSAAFALLFVCGAFWFIRRLQNENEIERAVSKQARDAQEKAEGLVSFLIGEDLLEKIRPLGKLEILDNIQAKVEANYGNAKTYSTDTQQRNAGLAHMNRGDLHYARYEFDDAEQEYRSAETIFQELQRRDSPQFDLHDSSDAQAKLAQLFEAELQLSKSYAISERVLEMQKTLATQKRGNHDKVMRDEAQTYIRLGEILQRQGQVAEALKRFETAAAMTPPLEKAELEWLYIRQDALTGTGQLLRKQGHTEPARDNLKQAQKCAERAVALSPFSPEAHYRIATAFNEIANLLPENPQETLAKYRDVNKDVENAAKWDPTNVQWQRDRAATYILLGNGNQAIRNWNAAADKYGEAVKQLEALMASRPGNVQLKMDLVWLRQSFGWAFYEMGQGGQDSAGSISQFRKLESHFDEMANSSDSSAPASQPSGTGTQAQSPGAKDKLAGVPAPSRIEPTKVAARNDAVAKGQINQALNEFELALKTVEELKKIDHTDEVLRETSTGLLWRKVLVLQAAGDSKEVLATCDRGLKEIGEKPVDASDAEYIANKGFFLASKAATYHSLGFEATLKGDAKGSAASYKRAEEELRSALAAWRTAVAMMPDNADYHNRIFLLYYDHAAPLRIANKDQAGALAAYREAAREVERSVALDSKNAFYRVNLALARQQIGDELRKGRDAAAAAKSYAEAEQALQQAIALKQDSADYHNRLFLILYDRVAPLKRELKDGAGTLSSYREAATEVEKSVQLDGKNVVYRSNLALARQQIGDELRNAGQTEEALAAYVQSDQEWRAAIDQKPDSPDYHNRRFLLLYDHVAPLRRKQNDRAGVLSAYRDGALEIERSTHLDPAIPVYQANLALVHLQIGDELRAQGDIPGARAAYAQSEQAWRASIAPKDSGDYENRLFLLYYDHVAVLEASQKNAAAQSLAYQNSIEAEKKAVALDPQNAVFQSNLALVYEMAGDQLRDQNNFKQAEPFYKLSLEAFNRAAFLDPKNARYKDSIGALYYLRIVRLRDAEKDEAGSLASSREAAKAEQEAAAIEPGTPVYHLNVGYAMDQVGEKLRKQHNLSESDAAFKQAEQGFRGSLKLKEDAGTWSALSLHYSTYISALRGDQKNPAGIVDAFRDAVDAEKHAVALEPANAAYRVQLALDQAITGNHLRERANQSEAKVFYTDAIASTSEVLKIAPDNFTAWNVRYAVFGNGIAPLCEEQHDITGALAAYESGLEAVEHVLASNSRNSEYQNYRGLALWKIGRLRRERGELVLAASAYTEAGRSFEKAASLNPTAARYHDSYGLFVEWMAPLRRQQKNRTATVEALQAGLNAAQKAASLEPTNAVHISNVATAHLQLGNEWRDAGKNSEAVEAYAQAEHSFREAIRLKNNDAHYWYGLSEALTGLARVNGTENQSAAKARYQEALQAISKSTELDPHEASYRTRRTFLETQLQTPSRK